MQIQCPGCGIELELPPWNHSRLSRVAENGVEL